MLSPSAAAAEAAEGINNPTPESANTIFSKVTTLSLDEMLRARPSSAGIKGVCGGGEKGSSRPQSGTATRTEGTTPPPIQGTGSRSRPVSGKGASSTVPVKLPPLPGASVRPVSGTLASGASRPLSGTHHAASGSCNAKRGWSAGAAKDGRRRAEEAGGVEQPTRMAAVGERGMSAASGTYTCSSYWTGSYFSGSESEASWEGEEGRQKGRGKSAGVRQGGAQELGQQQQEQLQQQHTIELEQMTRKQQEQHDQEKLLQMQQQQQFVERQIVEAEWMRLHTAGMSPWATDRIFGRTAAQVLQDGEEFGGEIDDSQQPIPLPEMQYALGARRKGMKPKGRPTGIVP